MNTIRFSQKLINRVLSMFRLQLVHRSAVEVPTLDGFLERIRKRGLEIGTFVDIGASDGRWSERVMEYYPRSKYLLVEGNRIHEPALKRFTAEHPNAEYRLAAAADSPGTVQFDTRDPLGGSASTQVTKGTVAVESTTADLEVSKRKLPPPYAIKLDTHGFEVRILEGASGLLSRTEVIIIECYAFEINHEALRFTEMCLHMEKLGFRPADLFDVLFRSRDLMFWQCDIAFMRSDRPAFASNSYD